MVKPGRLDVARARSASIALISRRALLSRAAAFAAAQVVPGRAAAGTAGRAAPLVGAIRWDAWQAPMAAATRAVVRSLSPSHYRHRLPFFSRIERDGTVVIEGGTQEIMDREIELAVHGGLDYWAFCAFARGDPMSVGLDLYLSSRRRRGLRFCLIAEPGLWGGPGRFSDAFEHHTELLRHADYVRVQGGRPLYFLGFVTIRAMERWGGLDGLRAALTTFRQRVRQGGAEDPYVVLMARPDPGAHLAVALGADALGAYAIADPRAAAAPYAELAAFAERRWDEMAATGLEVVPTVMAGWDRRPRVENPVPWERWQRPGAGLDKYYQAPRPEELAAHLRRCLAWIERHPRAAPARTALIYAWNENDEGGWLVPTHPFDASRLDALRSVLVR